MNRKEPERLGPSSALYEPLPIPITEGSRVQPPGREDVAIVLMAIPGEPVMDTETAGQVEELMSKGFAGTIFLSSDDVQGDFEALRDRGVEFTEEPEERPYGIDSAFRDPSGNYVRLVQVHEDLG
jgi:uncharacterized glyoxalase superfamily protein PhnB